MNGNGSTRAQRHGRPPLSLGQRLGEADAVPRAKQRAHSSCRPCRSAAILREQAPFGVLDLVGSRSGSGPTNSKTNTPALRSCVAAVPIKPQGAIWYFPQAYRNDQHGKLLLMAPGRDRFGCDWLPLPQRTRGDFGEWVSTGRAVARDFSPLVRTRILGSAALSVGAGCQERSDFSPSGYSPYAHILLYSVLARESEET